MNTTVRSFRSAARLLRLLALCVTAGLASASPLAARAQPAEVTIAFIGDQGRGADAEAVLLLIRDEGADAVVHSGDFDYEDDPAAWDGPITSILGADFSYFASAGNRPATQAYDSRVRIVPAEPSSWA